MALVSMIYFADEETVKRVALKLMNDFAKPLIHLRILFKNLVDILDKIRMGIGS